MGGKGGWTIAKPTAELGMRTVPSFSEPPLNRSSRAVSTGVPLFDFDLGSFVSEMRTTCILRKKDDRDSNIEIQPFPPPPLLPSPADLSSHPRSSAGGFVACFWTLVSHSRSPSVALGSGSEHDLVRVLGEDDHRLKEIKPQKRQ